MVFEKIFYGYRIGRIAFSFSFLILLFVYLSMTQSINISILILSLYFLSSIALFFYNQLNTLEFLLDIVFLTAFFYFTIGIAPYISILYLFPIFFYSLLSGKKSSFIVCLVSFISFLYIRIFHEDISIIEIFLNGFSFFMITLAGLNLHNKLKNQEKEIEKFEKLKQEKDFYKKLYEVAGYLAHEIRNPLASISGASQLLKEGEKNDLLIDIIYNETKRLDNLIKDFIILSMPRSEEKEKINIEEIIKNFILSCQKNIKLNIQQKFINFNKKSFEYMIGNIIKNACEWAKENIIVNVYKQDKFLYIIVEDDGVGIDEEIKNKVFEPFFSKNPKGTGLGLAIAKNIAINNNGDIIIEKSQNLGGAKFIITLEVNDESIDT